MCLLIERRTPDEWMRVFGVERRRLLLVQLVHYLAVVIVAVVVLKVDLQRLIPDVTVTTSSARSGTLHVIVLLFLSLNTDYRRRRPSCAGMESLRQISSSFGGCASRRHGIFAKGDALLAVFGCE